MIKQIQLLGMTFPNYSLRDELQLAQELLRGERLGITLTISMQSLMKVSSGDLEEEKAFVEQADLLVIEDPEILDVAGIVSGQRIREASEHLFFKEFLKRLQRMEKSLYLVAAKDAPLAQITEILTEHCSRLNILGSYSLEEYPEDYDRMINEINAAAPDVILSVLPTPMQEEFLLKNRSKLSAGLWYGLGENYGLLVEKKGLGWRMKHLIHLGRFKRHVNRYDEEGEQQNEEMIP